MGAQNDLISPFLARTHWAQDCICWHRQNVQEAAVLKLNNSWGCAWPNQAQSNCCASG